MKIKDLIVSFGLALGVTMLVQYLFFGNNETKQATAERVRVIPKAAPYRPLEINIDFLDKEIESEPVVTQIETDFAKLTFSSEGAALVSADFKHGAGSKAVLIPGIKSMGQQDRSFLLALNKKTPYYFDLINKNVLDDVTKLEYKAGFDGGYIVKSFTIYKHKPQVDLHISFVPNGNLIEPCRLRIVYDIPSIMHAADPEQAKLLQMSDDPLFGIIDNYGKVIKKPITSILDRYWESPINFGGTDRYLVLTTINNDSDFAQRGYFHLYSDNLLKAFLETSEITHKTDWDLSFYIGPKQTGAFDKVDSKLDQLLDFGILAPISKLLLRIMNFFYGFIGNFGWAIILLTILVKLVTLPFSWGVEKNSKKAAEMQRKMEYAEQKYRNDPEALSRAKAEIVQKYGMVGMGCLIPILIQFPVFVAIRSILTSSSELYMAPFLWISNLVNPDPLYIFPLLSAVGFFVKMSANNSDPRKKLNHLAVSIVIGALFANMSAGLTLHVMFTALLDMLQSKLYKRFGSN